MNNNMELWNKVKQPPTSALKTIAAGRLKGMTDINPQWRLQAITDAFGQCGVGWYYSIEKMWTEPGAAGELMAFVHVHLHTKLNDGWSAPIVGIGGSALVAKESAGLRANDEAYKMALTDALSVAMKQLGFAADIYAGKFDGSKYREDLTVVNRLPTLTDKEAEAEYIKWTQVKSLLLDAEGDIDQEKVINEWGKLPSNVRTAIKKHGDKVKLESQLDGQANQHINDIAKAA